MARVLVISLIVAWFAGGCIGRGETVRLGNDGALAKGRGIATCSPREAMLVALRFTRGWNTGNEDEVTKMVAEKAIIGIGNLPGSQRSPKGPQQAVELLRDRHAQGERIDLLQLTVNGPHKPPAVPGEVNIAFRFTIRSDDRELNLQPRLGKGGLGCQGVITRWSGGAPLG